MPAMAVLQSWYQGGLLHGRRTRGVTEAVIIYLVSSAITLSVVVSMGRFVGLYVGIASMVISMGLQTFWLWLQSHADHHAGDAWDCKHSGCGCVAARLSTPRAGETTV